MMDKEDISNNYGDFKRAEAEYKLQRQILKDYTDKWRHKTLKYLNFNAKEQKVGEGSQIASLFLSPKYTQDSNYAKFLQKVQAENRIGLNKRNSFNRDKYGKKTQSHNYELMGDILRRPVQSAPGPVMSGGWTFKESHKAGSCFGMNGPVIDYNQRRYCKWKERQKTQTSSPFLPDESYGGLKLSTNIKHKYGSSVCNDVLGDEMAVLQTVADLERKDRREKKLTPSLLQPNSYRSASLKSSCKKLSYYDLSNILRNNIFPGDGVTYNCGLTHSDYNDDICNEPTKVSQYRRRKIKLGF